MLDWARSVPCGAERDLAQTAMPAVGWSELGVDPAQLARCGVDGAMVEDELVDALAARHGVSSDEVALVSGCTQGAFCILASLIEPGSEVIVEAPTYGPLVDLVSSLGARVVRLPRPMGNAFLPDPAELRALLTPRTVAVVLTDLHNPSGAHLPPQLVSSLLDVIEEHSGARLVLDEVYLEFDPSEQPLSGYATGRPVIATRSVTKGFGLSWLRCGWVLASPDDIARVRRANDYLQVFLPSTSAVACSAALVTERDRRAAAAARVRGGYEIIATHLDRSDVTLVAPYAPAPAVCFPRIHATDATALTDALLARGVAVAPGHLFGEPAHCRIACAAAPSTLRAGLEILVELLDSV